MKGLRWNETNPGPQNSSDRDNDENGANANRWMDCTIRLAPQDVAAATEPLSLARPSPQNKSSTPAFVTSATTCVPRAPKGSAHALPSVVHQQRSTSDLPREHEAELGSLVVF